MQSNIEAYNYNLANDLSDFLNGYLSQFDFNYYLKDVHLSLDEVLGTKKFGLLYLFLFNQKSFIKNYVENLNKTNNSTFFITIENLYSSETFLNYTVHFSHNLLGNNPFDIDKTIYYNFISALAKNILKNSQFNLTNNITLDTLYVKAEDDLLRFILHDGTNTIVSKQDFVPINEFVHIEEPIKIFKTQSLEELSLLTLDKISSKRKKDHEDLNQ